MTPHLKPEILALLAGGDLNHADARAAAEHVAECEACGRELAELRRAVAQVRGWGADGEPPAEEIEALHVAVMTRLPRTARGWIPGWPVAVAAAVICASLALWAPWQGHRQDYLPTSVAVAGAKSHEDPAALTGEQKASSNPDRNVRHRLVTAQRGRGRSSLDSDAARLVAAGRKAVGQSAIPGSRSVSLTHDADGEPVLEIATANPNVLILWYVDEGSKKDNDDE